MTEPAPAFLGRGWSFPPTFDPVRRDVVTVAADDDIRQSLRIILGTALGERIMLPTFGCDLPSKVFATLTTTAANEIAAMVTRAIVDWEPRVTVDGVSVADALQDGWVDIRIAYHVRQTNSRSNLVIPFCRLEATLLPPGS